jgi:CheY-like chemotaxis protein
MKRHRILVVDDEEGIRQTRALFLSALGYEVSTAENGFDALLHLKNNDLPDLIISDLNMPEMSGFEFLSVVRRRFPSVLVIASSGAYDFGSEIPGGLIADGFHAKSGDDPSRLWKMIEELLAKPPEWAFEKHLRSAPVWIPRSGNDSTGKPFVVITCTNCLRSFPVTLEQKKGRLQEVECLFCLTTLQYVIDFSEDTTLRKKPRAAALGRAS